MSCYDHWKTTNPDDEWLGPEDAYVMPANPDYADDDEELSARARVRDMKHQWDGNEAT